MLGQAKQARLRPNPKLFMDSEDLQPWNGNYTYSQQTEDYAYLSQDLELDRKRSKRLHVASAQLQETEAKRARQIQQLDARVASSYWQAVAAAGTVTLLTQDLAAVKQMVRYQKAQVNAGAMRGVDLLRMQIEQDRLTMELDAARRRARVAMLNLATQIGSPLPSKVKLTNSLETIEKVPEVPLSRVLRQRPEVRMAREALAAAKANVKLQKAMGVPDLTVIAGYKRNLTDNTMYAGLQIPLPIFNRNQGRVESANANVQAAQDYLKKTTLLVNNEVASATAAYQQELNTVETTLPDERQRASRNLTIMRDAYKSGGVSLLRYLDAERTEINVEVGALQTLAAFHMSEIQLQLAYGVQP